MKKNLVKEIQKKTQKLLEIKKRYNDHVRAIDEEFSDQIKQFHEKSIHIPMDLAKNILLALESGNTNTEKFKQDVKNFSDLINYMSDSESDSESNNQYAQNEDDFLDNSLNTKSLDLNESNSAGNNNGNINEENDQDEDLLMSDDVNTDDSLSNISDVKIDPVAFIQNYEDPKDFDV